jgi:hypothetical protein
MLLLFQSAAPAASARGPFGVAGGAGRGVADVSSRTTGVERPARGVA